MSQIYTLGVSQRSELRDAAADADATNKQQWKMRICKASAWDCCAFLIGI